MASSLSMMSQTKVRDSAPEMKLLTEAIFTLALKRRHFRECQAMAPGD